MEESAKSEPKSLPEIAESSDVPTVCNPSPASLKTEQNDNGGRDKDLGAMAPYLDSMAAKPYPTSDMNKPGSLKMECGPFPGVASPLKQNIDSAMNLSLDLEKHGQTNPGNINVSNSTSKKRKGSQTNRNALEPPKKGTSQASFIKKLKGNVSAKDTVSGLLCKYPAQTGDPKGNTFSSNGRDNEEDDRQALAAALKTLGNKCQLAGTEEGLSNGTYSIDGMKTKLRDYQVVGVAFMLRLERGRTEPHGGIIADQMGVGKTVQAIACMVLNQPSSATMIAGGGATLIVMPSEHLIKQWIKECSKHMGDEMAEGCLHYQARLGLPVSTLKRITFM